MKYQLSLLLTILVSSLIYSQTEYVEKYDNEQIRIQGFLIDSVLIGKYTEYYEDGSLKIQRVIQELKDDIEKESFKEYYPNGFLKTESEIIDLDKNGIYREFYENGNTKYEGIFKDDKPIDKHYFYNSKGEITKIETWKEGKIIETELKKASG